MARARGQTAGEGLGEAEPRSRGGARGAASEQSRSSGRIVPMDDLNRAIVEMLRHDGRMPFIDIAKQLKVSEGTVRNRVSAMKRGGMLRIIGIADPMAVNYKADAMLGIKVGPKATPRKVAGRLAPSPEVVYVLWVSGRFDLLVEIVCDDDARLNRFLEDRIYGADDIASVEVMGGLEMFKNQFLLKRDLPL